MLLLISLLVLSIGIAFLVYESRHYTKTDAWEILGAVFTFIGVAALVICLVIIGINHIGVDGNIAKYEHTYEVLTYQYENNLYNNDNDIGKKELLNQIQAWNEDLAWHKVNQRDFWIGIFIPNIYDQFEFINLEGSYA